MRFWFARQTLTQLETPDEMRGRGAAVNAIFIGASNQLGEFESGATAALWGPVAWRWLFPALALRDHMQPQAPRP